MSGRVENETELIQTYLAPLAAREPGALGLTDDAAFFTPPPDSDLVVTTDPVIAGVHFLAHQHAEDIAWKALAVNVSDLAAKGAVPIAYTMALAFPEAPERTWMAAFARGLGDAQAAFGCTLVGGDTDRTTGPLSISITVFGAVPKGGMVRRGAAKIGDRIYVTGTLGDAALGLIVQRDPQAFESRLTRGDRDFLSARYLRPSPRLELAPHLRMYASAALDISDGLAKDLARLAAGAGGKAAVALADLPLSPAARRVIRQDPAHMAAPISGGDDYELLFAVPDCNGVAFEAALGALPFAVTRIGTISKGRGVAIVDATGNPVALGAMGYDHFA